jgi:hypothetical protein
MAQHLVCSLSFAALAAALLLQGCGNSVPLPTDRASSRPLAASSVEVDSHAAADTAYRARVRVDAGRTGPNIITAVNTPPSNHRRRTCRRGWTSFSTLPIRKCESRLSMLGLDSLVSHSNP